MEAAIALAPMVNSWVCCKAWPFDLRRELTGRNLIPQSSTFFRRTALELGWRTGCYSAVLDGLRSVDSFVAVPMYISGCARHSVQLPASWSLKQRRLQTVCPWCRSSNPFWIVSTHLTCHPASRNGVLELTVRIIAYLERSTMGWAICPRARSEFLQAIRHLPCTADDSGCLLPMSWIPCWAARLGPAMQRLRWRLPDVPEGDLLLGEGKTAEWL